MARELIDEAGTSVTSIGDQELVARFVAATDRLSRREIEEATAGEVSASTAQRFQSGSWKRLYPRTRRALERYLAAGGTPNDRAALTPEEQRRALQLAEELVELLRRTVPS